MEANRCSSVLDLRCLPGVPVWDVRVAWFIRSRSKLEVCIGVDDAVCRLGGSSGDRHGLTMKDDVSERQQRGSRRFIDVVCARVGSGI